MVDDNFLKYNGKKSTLLREERDRALFLAYNKAIMEHSFRSQEEAVEYVRTHDAPRFYIEGDFCRIVLTRIRRGGDVNSFGELQKKKFQELLRRFEEERAKPKNAGLSVLAICDIIVSQPAPEFYLSNRSARLIISRQRKLKCKELMQNR